MPSLTPPSTSAGLSTTRFQQLDQLATTSTVPVSIFVLKPGGAVTDLRGRFPAETDLTHFLLKIAPAIGLPQKLEGLKYASSEDLGQVGTRVFYSQQTQSGIPVFGAGVAVDIDTTGAIIHVTVRRSEADIGAKPKMGTAAAAAALAKQIGTTVEAASAPELVVVDPAVLFDDSAPPFLGWRSSIAAETGSVQVVIPDSDGEPVVVVTGPGTGSGWEPVPRYHVNDATGTPDFVTFAPFGLILPEAATGSAAAVAFALFERYPLFFGTGDVPNQLRLLEVSTDAGPSPMYHVRLQQIYAGIPVFGCLLNVHMTSTLAVMSVSGNYLRSPAIAMDVVVDQDTARNTAVLNSATIQLADSPGAEKPKPLQQILAEISSLHPTQLAARPDARIPEVLKNRNNAVFNMGLEVLPGVLASVPTQNHLTWRFRFTEGDFFISARTGQVVFTIPNLLSARLVWDALTASPISLAIPRPILADGLNVNATPPGNTDIMPADSEAAGAVGFWALLGRSGWNGAGADTIAVTNATFPFPNAMFVPVRFSSPGLPLLSLDPPEMWFSPGMVRPDVVAHEFTHGVTFYTALLLPLDESGAINEHYSDVMGNLAAPDSLPTNWFVGETGPGGAGSIRDMKNPTVGNYAGFVRRTGTCTGVLAPLTTPACDAGGVHTNCGIGNRAAVLLCDGDGTAAHPGIGRSRLGRLFADTLTTRLHPWSRYLDELHNTWEVARDLSRRGVLPASLPATSGTQPVFTAPFVQNEVVWAFTQVGVDLRLMTGWFEVGGGLLGGRGTVTFNASQMLPAGFVVGDVELVVRALDPIRGQLPYWEGRSLVSTGGAVTFPGGVFGASVISHGIGTPSEMVVVRWFHSGFLPLEITVNMIPVAATAPTGPTVVLPTDIESVSAAMVHFGGFGGKNDDTVNSGVSVTGTGCTITNVILELLDRDYQVQATHQMGQAPATYGGTGAEITSQNIGSADATVGVHWWYNFGWACRYQLRYLISGTGCSL
jgi:thermolysin